ncbi:MAG: NADH-quinone oxidoreductase subunit B family protein [Candidatus Omnitrophica bacterium]|nr:NADH-quinone oxidoreductase subunit B family protein [Candidatus Omnitrophota bacterium]
MRIIKNRILKGIVTKPLDKSFSLNEGLETTGAELKKIIQEKFSRSLHIREVDTGSCGACESEIISTTNPIYDIQRFGVSFVASPRHADCLLVTGPVSKNMALALKKTYDAMPEPKFVITLGRCALDGGIFKDAYYTEKGVANIIPVAFHIPGCPPKPLDIIKALITFLKAR